MNSSFFENFIFCVPGGHIFGLPLFSDPLKMKIGQQKMKCSRNEQLYLHPKGIGYIVPSVHILAALKIQFVCFLLKYLRFVKNCSYRPKIAEPSGKQL